MKKSMFLMVVLLAFTLLSNLIPVSLNAQGSGSFTDQRDGVVYFWTKVGDQTWMARSLRYAAPKNSWTYNGDDSVHVYKYGRLYNWAGAKESCPKGWRLPSDKDWNKLIETLGPARAGEVVQAWDTVGLEEGLHQFSSMLSGVRYTNGVFLNVNYWGACWSATEINDSTAVNYLFSRGAKEITQSTNDKRAGFAVRCIKK
jgi:uncharacterized protein (TIGR02145 family)